MRVRSVLRLSCALSIAACNAPFPPDARLTLGVQPTSVSVPVGGEQSTAVTLTRIGDYNGDVASTVDGLPSTYNTSATLRLSDGTRTMSVTATTAYTGTTGVVLSTPDLSGVSWWPSALAIANGAHGNWMVSANGAPSNTPLCTENMRSIVAWQSGTF